MDEKLEKKLNEISERLEEGNDLQEGIYKEILKEKYSRWSQPALTIIAISFAGISLSINFYFVGKIELTLVVLFSSLAIMFLGAYKFLKD